MLFSIKYKLVVPGYEGKIRTYHVNTKSEAEAMQRLQSLIHNSNPDIMPQIEIIAVNTN